MRILLPDDSMIKDAWNESKWNEQFNTFAEPTCWKQTIKTNFYGRIVVDLEQFLKQLS